MRQNSIHSLICLGLLSLALTGCSDNFVTQPSGLDAQIVEGLPFKGSAMGGQQPIGASHLYLFAVGHSGYGGASISLINAAPTATYPSQLDSAGNYYITTDPTSGNFQFTAGQYSCTVGQQVYLYLTGGNVGNGANSAIAEMAMLGTCNASGLFSQLTGNFVYMNEVSTVAAAYALAGFATDSTDIGSSSTTLAATGVLNAANNAANIYNINAGAAQGALAATPQGNGTVPQAEINLIADMLAACINSSGASSTNCTNLFSYTSTTTGGLPTHSTPETATAAINIAHHPASNVANLFGLVANTAPFQPTITPAPADYSVVIAYTTGTGNQPTGMAIDAAGNVWITNNYAATVTELANNGKVLSATGYTNSSMSAPTGIAIDASGNAWVVDEFDFLIKFTGTGSSTAYSSPSGSSFTGDAQSIAIDKNGYIWVGQNSTSAVQLSAGSTTLTQTAVASGAGLNSTIGTQSVAIDSSNNVLFVNQKERGTFDSVSDFNSSGTPIVGQGTTGFGYGTGKVGIGIAVDGSGNFWLTNSATNDITIGATLGGTTALTTPALGSAAAGLSAPQGIAFDGSSNAWVANNYGTLSVLNNLGAAVTGTAGYSGSLGNSMSGISEIAVDGSGNVWALNNSSGRVFEFVGSATPVITPLVAALSAPATKP